MDMAGEDASIEPKNMSSQWQLNRNNITNTSMVINPTSNLNDESSACSSNTMAESICPPIWDQPINGQSLGYRDMIVENNTSTSNTLGDGNSSIVPVRRNAILRGSTFLPDFPVMLPSSSPHLPADSGFIERAARFSCFGGGNFVDMMSPFRISESLNPYTRDLASQGPLEVLKGNGSKSLPVMQTQIHEMNAIECYKEVSLPVEQGTEGSPIKNDKMIEHFPSSHDEANLGIGVSAHKFAEAEFSGSGFQGELEDEAGESSAKELGSKKRKRTGQVNKGCRQPANETAKDHAEIQQQGGQNRASSKPCGKHDRPGSQGSDLPKEEYVHVRARKGQATNSHSLAERVRREKISERMKFLQDLVPGCSKVTGKAVMLDEIINYVQSLQRQVEFLSMKLVTVNSRMDFNIEGLLAKEPRAGPPSSSAFSSYMTMPYPPLHQSQTGIIQAVLPRLGSSSGPLQGSVNPQLTTVGGRYKESTSQVHCAWEDEFRNIIQMGFTSNDHLNSQNFSGHMKTDL